MTLQQKFNEYIASGDITISDEQRDWILPFIERCVGDISYDLVNEFHDNLITIAVNNEHLRGCVTSNQIIQAFQDFEASTHDALTQEDKIK